MAKRRAKKKTARSLQKASIVDKIFSVKKIFIYSLLIMFSFLGFNFLITSNKNEAVMGVQTSTQYAVISASKINSYMTSHKSDYFVGVNIFLDVDSNAQKHPYESWFEGKPYSFYFNNVLTTSKDGSGIVVDTKSSCNTITLDVSSGSLRGYKVTGFNYWDVNTKKKIKVVVNKKSIKVCAAKGQLGASIEFGVKK